MKLGTYIVTIFTFLPPPVEGCVSAAPVVHHLATWEEQFLSLTTIPVNINCHNMV